jgi:hypothetical protein
VHAVKVQFTPKHQTIDDEKKPIALVPRRVYWLDHDTMQVIKEERHWDWVKDNSWQFNNEAYSEASYDIYSPIPKPEIPKIDPQGSINKVTLSGHDKNSFLTYATVEEAEKAEGIKINMPTRLPEGFVLKDIQVFTLFGARIQVLNFTDGINDMMITIRPQQNAFVTLMAGAFSLNLIKKISDLSSQAPNNYYSNASEKRIAVVFGDVIPIELQRVATSLTL